MTRRCWATIDLDALRNNLGQVRRYAPGTRVMAVVKANAYGHGLLEVTQALADADAFAVATLSEALRLRQSGIRKPIVLLGGVVDATELPLVAEHDLQPVLHDVHQLDLIEGSASPQSITVWIKLDTGMHRLGFLPEQMAMLQRRLSAMPNVWVQGWLTHFASADETDNTATRRQIDCFRQTLQQLPGDHSLANSAGVIAWPDSHAEWVRPGIMLYGASPVIGRSADELGLRPVMTLRSRLMSIRELPAGEPVGYGATWVTPERMRIGVLSVGYGDGYPRHAPSGTPVMLQGRRVSLVGRVSMDLITVDLRACGDAHVGDEAVLWGAGLPADEIAQLAGTIAYELFCGLSNRVEFEYRG